MKTIVARTPWFGITMGGLLLAFGGFIAYLIYDEVQDDHKFRQRCTAQGSTVVTQDSDSVRICVRFDQPKNQVIVDVER